MDLTPGSEQIEIIESSGRKLLDSHMSKVVRACAPFGRLPGQAPEIDPIVYLTDCDPSAFPSGSMIDVQIVGAEGYDLLARPL